MRDYELMWILPGSTSDDDGDSVLDRVKELVTNGGGDVKSAEFWGRRTLSYAIQKHREGAYYLAKFSMDPSHAQEIDRAMVADQAVIRHLMVKDELHKVGR